MSQVKSGLYDWYHYTPGIAAGVLYWMFVISDHGKEGVRIVIDTAPHKVPIHVGFDLIDRIDQLFDVIRLMPWLKIPYRQRHAPNGSHNVRFRPDR